MEAPFVSIVIPTYHRSRPLAACLTSVAALDYPRDRFEVIVVDDGGSVSLDGQVGSLRDRLDLTLIKRSARGATQRGPAAARNLGAERARGELLAFIDDDCQPDPGWLRAVADRYMQAPAQAVGGRIVNLPRKDVYARAGQFILDLVYEFYNAGGSKPRFFASNNLAFPRDDFIRVGGFDPGFHCPGGEDRELCDRWIQLGHGMTYAPHAVVYHARPGGFRAFARQYFGYGRGAYLYNRARAARGSGRLRSDLGFYRLLARTAHRPLRGAGASDALLLLALLAVWQIANTAGFAWEGVRSRARQRAPASAIAISASRKPPSSDTSALTRSAAAVPIERHRSRVAQARSSASAT